MTKKQVTLYVLSQDLNTIIETTVENKIIMYNVFVHVVISQKLDRPAEAICFNLV